MPVERRERKPNMALGRLVDQSGMSTASLSHRVNALAKAAGVNRAYSHTSVANWVRRGMKPRAPAPRFLAAALGERLVRHVSLEEIGMQEVIHADPEIGLDFPRNPDDALQNAAKYWSTVNRRTLLGVGPSFAISVYTTPVNRWLVKPADPSADQSAPDGNATTPVGRLRREAGRVGAADLEELWTAAEEARRWDSKFGGGNWRSSSVVDCLKHRAAPLLRGTHTEEVSRELFTVTAELARVAARSAFDAGDHHSAQRHFVQALRLARASGDVQCGAYVLATVSLQTMLRGYTSEAVDMAEGAYERSKHEAAPRVLAFVKLAEARAHGKAGDARSAAAALTMSKNLLDRIGPDTRDPAWLRYLTHARISTDAAEIYRDLANPAAALRWNRQADAPSASARP